MQPIKISIHYTIYLIFDLFAYSFISFYSVVHSFIHSFTFINTLTFSYSNTFIFNNSIGYYLINYFSFIHFALFASFSFDLCTWCNVSFQFNKTHIKSSYFINLPLWMTSLDQGERGVLSWASLFKLTAHTIRGDQLL